MRNRSPAFETDRRLTLPGLKAAALIRVDRHGIAHLKAASEHDLFFVQGFNAARDRLFQIDLWRRRGLGLLAADLGPGYLEQDKASRAFVYRGDMAAEWASYGAETQAICTRFAAGINAYVDWAERHPGRLPPEFAVLGMRPARWQAEDVVRIRSHALTRNALWEVQRLHMLERADARADLLRKMLYPPVAVTIPPGVTARDCPIEALATFRLAQANVTFSPERLAAGMADAGRWRRVNDLNEVLDDLEATGSNNWVVAAGRTGTGAPILASDPHRAHSLPSLRYIQHLTAPGLDIIGAGEPCIPGLSFGHNGQSAFAMTIFGADQEDVYCLETDPDDPFRYRFDGGWRAMDRVRETIAVKGHGSVEHEIAYSHHGPVIWRNAAGTRAVAVRSVWFEPGTAPYLHGLTVLRARTPDAFRAAAERWGTPSANYVYADRTGEIAWSPAGYMPLRVGWKGLTPVPGDGRYEWLGFIDPALMPFVRNPDSGYLATANEMNLPDDWDHDTLPVGFEWTEPSRANRIHEVLGAGTVHDVAAAAALQTDTTSLPARRLCTLVAAIDSDDADVRLARALFAGWNHRLDAQSAAAALFETWYTRHLRGAVFATLVPEAARSLLPPGDVEGLCRALEQPDERFGPEPAAGRDALLARTLAAAWREVAGRLGPAPERWQWGMLHHGYFEHPLTALTQRDPDCTLDVGPLAKGGSASSPMHAGYRPADFRVTHGASFRMVVDLADPDRSIAINAPGQSGDPRSTHFDDLAPLWAAGHYVPLPYSEAAVSAATAFTWILEPAGDMP